MGFFNNILNKLGLGKKDEDAAPSTSASSTGSDSPKPAAPAAKATGSGMADSYGAAAHAAASSAHASASSNAISEVDVVKQLETKAAGSGLDWKVSIVDLLKLLDIDSSKEARTELAKELNCPADLMSDSAKMNTWLHKTVLKKIAENGGNIPANLLD